jgi:hypothetical protein
VCCTNLSYISGGYQSFALLNTECIKPGMVLCPENLTMSVNCHKNLRLEVTEFLIEELDTILKIGLNLFISTIIK